MKEEKLKVLFASFEAVPFIKTGGLGDVGGSLPSALRSAGVDVRLILPKLKTIPEQYKAKMKHLCDFEVQLSWRRQYCGIETLRHGGVTCYFIDNEYYFGRDSAYGYFDDGERIAFFAKAVTDCAMHLGSFKPDIIHCHDWHTALVPVYLRSREYASNPKYAGIKTVFTIHNLKFQGVYDLSITGDVLGFSEDEARSFGLSDGTCINYMRGALMCCDRITTVSPTYAGEIQTAYYGEGLDGVLRERSGVLTGILNGIDMKSYDPGSDKALKVKYDAESRIKRAQAKAVAQRELDLPERADVPLAVIISRLTEQKGLDLVLGVLDELLSEDIQLAVLGIGDKKYEDAFKSAAHRYPEKFSVCLGFDEALSRRMYSGADMALVPSKFEPCGLTQMIAMRYGALPVVRETGGLKDSVVPHTEDNGTGFVFTNYNAHELLFTLKEASRLFKEDPAAWDKLTENAMNADLSWNASAGKYAELFKNLAEE